MQLFKFTVSKSRSSSCPSTRQGLVACRLLLLTLAALASLIGAAPASGEAPGHGRAWELVTPQTTHGTQFVEARAWGADGDRIAYATLGPMPGAESGELTSHNVSVREPTGWRSEPVTVP